MKQSSVFSDPQVQAAADKLREAAKNRFASLDAFNADVKSATILMRKCAMPDVDWVVGKSYALGWHDETIVFHDIDWSAATQGPKLSDQSINDAWSIHDASANQRHGIASEGLLAILLKEAANVIAELPRQKCPKCDKAIQGFPAISRDEGGAEICTPCGQKEALQAFIDAEGKK